MTEINTVTIPLEEYIELRRNADENFYCYALAREADAPKEED